MARRRHGPYPWPDSAPTDRDRRAFADAEPRPFWTARLPEREPWPAPRDSVETDLAIVGAGLTGMWAAALAKEDEPELDVIVLEGESNAYGASGRNGGFIVSSLTHGQANGEARWPHEMEALERLGLENFRSITSAVERHGIACDLELTGTLQAALHERSLPLLAEEAEILRRYGHEITILDRGAARAELDLPILEGALWQHTGAGIVDPAKLCRGLERVAVDLGVRVFEDAQVTSLEEIPGHVRLLTPSATVDARRVLLATNAYSPLLGAIRRRVVPVYEHVLMTEPLSPRQMSAIRWHNRQGVGTLANALHYFRLTDDNRILWGGYDALYYYGSAIRPELEQRDASFAALSQQFFAAFPQLEDVRFTHRWGGVIDTCSRFSVFFGTALDRRVAYAVGYTGLGVGATRFGARVALDLLAGRDTEAMALDFVKRKPIPFPPEPLRWVGIRFTSNRMSAADRRDGRRGIWLRALDRLGLGFDA